MLARSRAGQQHLRAFGAPATHAFCAYGHPSTRPGSATLHRWQTTLIGCQARRAEVPYVQTPGLDCEDAPAAALLRGAGGVAGASAPASSAARSCRSPSSAARSSGGRCGAAARTHSSAARGCPPSLASTCAARAGDSLGQLLALPLLTVAAAESATGLSHAEEKERPFSQGGANVLGCSPASGGTCQHRLSGELQGAPAEAVSSHQKTCYSSFRASSPVLPRPGHPPLRRLTHC